MKLRERKREANLLVNDFGLLFKEIFIVFKPLSQDIHSVSRAYYL